jgi:hypothetical protein
VDSVPNGSAKPAPRWILAGLFILLAWCTYLHVPLVVGGRLLVPSYPTVMMIPFLLMAVRREITNSDLAFLSKVAFVLLLSIALSPGYAYIQQKLFGMFQFLMAVVVAVLIVRLMKKLPQRTLEGALLTLWILILVGSVLEVMEVIRAPSDAFRAWAYEGTYTLYDANLRDMNLVGWERPKLFSSEPSHVTKFFIVSVNAWLLVRVTGVKAAVVAGATVAMLVIMGSPMLLVSAAITLSILMWNQRATIGTRVLTVMGVLMIGALVGVYFAESTFSMVASRVAQVGVSSNSGGLPSSEERRMVLPYETLMKTWQRWPLFGAGVGGKEVVAQLSDMSSASATFTKGNNALADIGIFLGILGGTLFVYLVLTHARQTGVAKVSLLAGLLFLFSQLMGGIDTVRYWGFVALFWGALAVANASTVLNPRTTSQALE